MFYFLGLTVVLLATAAVASLAATRPGWTWMLVVTVSLVASGPMILGRAILDEYFLALILLGFLVYDSVYAKSRTVKVAGRGVLEANHQLARLHFSLFLLLSAYMAFRSVQGLFEMDVQKLRWVVFFIMLGLTAVFLERRKSSIPSQHQMVAAITLSTLVYMAAYLLHGITAENIRGSFRWDLQTVEWGATVYAMFPIAFAMPAVLLSTVSGSSWHRLVGWVTLLLTFVAVIYYESRIGLFTVLAFLVLSPIYIGGRRLLGILTLVAALLVLFGPSIRYQHGSLSEYGSSLLLSGSAFWPRGDIADTHDIDRWIHAKLAFKAVSGDWSTFLFGHGYRVHGEVISPYLYELYREFLPRSAQRIAYYQSTAGFTALVVDTGVVALALLVTNFLLVGCRIIREKELAYKPLLLLSLVLPFAWLLSGNILDITLLYVGVMPSGLLVGMARAGGRNALAQRSPPAASGLGYRRGWPRLAGAGLSGR